MSEMFFVMAIKPFLLLACLVAGYPITHYVRHKMKKGQLRDFLLTDLDPKETARQRERAEKAGISKPGK